MGTHPAPEAGALRDVIDRGADWLLERMSPAGEMRGAPPLTAYYKLPCALAWSGHTQPARRALEYVRERFLRAGGDLDGTGVPWFDKYRIYPHAWLAVGAAELGDSALAAALAGRLESAWNAESGGFRGRSEGAEEEIMTTSMAALACLLAGRNSIARGAAAWLANIFSAQPDLRRGLYHVWDPAHGLVEGDGSAAYLVDASKPRQWYFQYGISAAFLAAYSRRSTEKSWLDLARRFLHASALCYEDAYRTPQSGKIGWGAAWVHALTSDPADAALVAKVSEGLGALQCGDGSWNTEGVYEAKPSGSPESRMDVTAEFVALLSQMEKPRV
jgi:hypothetical protein